MAIEVYSEYIEQFASVLVAIQKGRRTQRLFQEVVRVSLRILSLFSDNGLSFQVHFCFFGSPTIRCGKYGRLFEYLTEF